MDTALRHNFVDKYSLPRYDCALLQTLALLGNFMADLKKLYSEHKMVFLSVVVGIGAWIMDAALDSLVFNNDGFLDALILDVTPHELYFRLFVMFVVILFGVVTSRTLAHRKAAEDELRKALTGIEEEKAKTDAIIAAIPDGISIQSRDYRVLYQNSVHKAMVGDQLGRICYEKYARRDAICPGCPVARSFGDGGNHVLEKTISDGNGGTRFIEITSSPFRNAAGEIVAGIEAVRDITAHKHAETELQKHRERLEELVAERTAELKSANDRLQREVAERERMEDEMTRVQQLESLGLLAGGIAHDFNNLLGSIMGSVSLAMLDVDPSNPAHRQLVKAEQVSLRAQDLTRQLLTFSRGGAPVKKLVALAGIIGEAAGFSLRDSRVLHEIDVPKDLWPVEADEGQVMQVLNNLLINADQAMPTGGVIRISARNITLGPDSGLPLGAGRYVKLLVADEGTGIPAEHVARVFDPFFTTKQKGSGLGLAVSYSIIRKHEGLMTVESGPGRGATFHVYLPASQGEVAFSPHDDMFTKGSGHVLVMDDEEEMRSTTADMLERLGYTVDHARDGAEAIEKYRCARDDGRPFDAVIMDLTVPGGMGGKEAIRKLLELDPLAKAIVSSGYSHDPVMSDFRAYGFQGMVTKPYRLRDLSEVVASVIGSGGR
jgi:signal transduction histidine kinase/CheY-like chemotaxis protein